MKQVKSSLESKLQVSQKELEDIRSTNNILNADKLSLQKELETVKSKLLENDHQYTFIFVFLLIFTL